MSWIRKYLHFTKRTWADGIMTGVFLGLFLGFSGSLAGAQDLKRIKIGYPAISYNQIHIWVAKDAGLFRKQGLDAEIVFFRGGQTATQALVAGDPPIINIGLVVQAGLQGHDAVLIASTENTYNYSVVARPGIATVEQLKGRRLGVSSFGSASHNAALIVLKNLLLNPIKTWPCSQLGRRRSDWRRLRRVESMRRS